ncbi:MAG: phosphotransferase system, enzyme I, PtsP [Candidatus Magnetoglobus multicellularis str. Araruama]|uniref:phosphoenolpyruvate--protein phosphotransferase n=1 Tax=Candidatus Magnetoglobus multicellularis str. Araruama TaxID=890399 RepID=A0A1V1PBR7_9BACT|nr:MAG: phosphotransferase system, enzyme I, PtsP [Candidatus Magnetoglobus multicellularis str. Araruama]
MKRDDIRILGEISRITTEYDDPNKILAKMVSRIARRFKVDVCSIYIINIETKELILRATYGLNPSVIDHLKMNIDEGLTGWVVEQRKPVFTINPRQHPRFKLYKDSGEEIYQTFLGLPLVYRNDPLGVMVIQTQKIDAINSEDIPVFSTIAIQVSTAVVYSGLLDRMNQTQKNNRQSMLQGTAVSPGIAKGYVHYFGENFGFDMVEYEKTDNIQQEISRLEIAFSKALAEIKNMGARVKDLSGQKDAIVEAHIMLLNDHSLKNKILDQINNGLRAATALKQVVTDYLTMFSKMEDSYLKERGADLEDIGRRILRHLLGIPSIVVGTLSKDTILITSDISPIDLASMKQKRLKAIVLSRGGATSHTVILATSFELPMVIQVKGVLDLVKEGDYVLVDGHTGLVFKDPPKNIIDEYDRLASSQRKEVIDTPAITKDNFCVSIGANIGMIPDLALMERYGADHIGLYRSEFPFLIRQELPTEEDQFELYQSIIVGAKGRPVTIRTLDVGGDKFLSYLEYPKENNPFLGWRSIRVSLELEDIFRTQIRAILRAACSGDTRILFPMISSIGEIHKIINIVNMEKQKLFDEKIDFDADIPIGIMVEVPGIVRILDRAISYIDFVSIGTNDLIQYMLAVDRNNQKVSSLYDPLHPSIIEIIRDVAQICKKVNKPISICGESAANIFCAYLFIGMQIDSLSMNPGSVPKIKKLICDINQKDAEADLNKVLNMEEGTEIKEYLECVLWEWNAPD